MHRSLHHGIIALTLLGSIGLAVAADEAKTTLNPWKGEAQMPPAAAMPAASPAAKEAGDPNTGSANTGAAESGPIGATGQTMPSKLSPQNQAIDGAPLIPPQK